MLVWLAFGVFIGAILIAALLIPPHQSGAGAKPAPFSPASHS
jgi:hypothetical protein